MYVAAPVDFDSPRDPIPWRSSRPGQSKDSREGGTTALLGFAVAVA